MAKIAGSTLRRYVSLFQENFSESAIRPRGRRFTERDIVTIGRIKKMFSDGKTEEDIMARLLLVDDDEPLSDDILALIPSVSKSLTHLEDVAYTARAELGSLRQQFEGNEATHEELRSELGNIADHIATMNAKLMNESAARRRLEEKLRQREGNWKKYWQLSRWRRLFAKPPND